MTDFLSDALGFPTVILTVLFGVVLAYWVLALLGAVGFDALDGLFDGVADSIDGALDGAIDGAADGAVDGLGDGGGDAAGGGLLERLGIGTVPATIVLSVVVVFMWFFAMIGTSFVNSLALGTVLGSVAIAGMLLVGFLLSCVMAALVARPLSKLFVTVEAQQRRDLLGLVCTVKTQRVDGEFGQAEVFDEDGASLLLQVRAAGDDRFERGDQALLVDVDDRSGAYFVSTVDEMLAP